MDFDEYDYLEQTIENPVLPKASTEDESGKSGKRQRSEKSYKHREGSDGDIKQSRSNKERSDKQNGERNEKRDVSTHGHDRHSERNPSHRRGSPRGSEKDDRRGGRSNYERESRNGERDKEYRRPDKGREAERERASVRERDNEREREKEKGRDNSPGSGIRSARHRNEQERDVERLMERRSREGEAMEKERGNEKKSRRMGLETEIAGGLKEKKEVEPDADPERDQRTVFAYQMPLKATERDVYEFFSRAGKVRDVRLIMDRNSRRSKGVGYVEFYDAMSVPMAIALSGQPLFGQPVMVKPSEAEKNLVQSTASAAGAGGLDSAVARKLYVGNLHFNMTEDQLRQVFEAFGPVELVQLPLDQDTGHCKGFGFVQFAQLEHAKAALCLNGKLEIAGRTIKVSAVTDHAGMQDIGANAADFDDDDGGGLSLNARSRAMLMQKLDRTGTATSIVGSLGTSLLNGANPVQPPILPFQEQLVLPTSGLSNVTLPAAEPVGLPSECLLLKNMFDPSSETEPDFDLDIKEDVQEECSNFGVVKHIFVDKKSLGHVYLKFDSVAAASSAQLAMHGRWFAGRMITTMFMPLQQYDAKFEGV